MAQSFHIFSIDVWSRLGIIDGVRDSPPLSAKNMIAIYHVLPVGCAPCVGDSENAEGKEKAEKSLRLGESWASAIDVPALRFLFP
jgi:hypothetical protein